MSKGMKSLVKKAAVRGVTLCEKPIPRIRSHEVLIEVKTASLCGTDYHLYAWDDWAKSRVHPPIVMGHEFSGVVREVGAEVANVRIGDHVSAESHFVCGTCFQCRTGQSNVCQNTKILGVDRDGCFAEFVAIPAQNVWVNEPDLPFDIACLLEPCGNAVHTALSGEIAGRSVAVMGVGPVGLMAVAVSRAAGASQVIAIDVNNYRLKLAQTLGATTAICSKKNDPIAATRQLTGGIGADVVLEMSGHPTGIRQSFALLRNGGRISMLGISNVPVEFDVANDIVFKGAVIHGITGRRMYETWYQLSGLLRSKQLNLAPLVTHHYSFEQFEQAFAQMAEGNCGKVVLTL